MGTNCAPLVADLFFKLPWILLTVIIKLVLSRPLIRLLGTSMTFFNIDNPYFEGMVNQIYPPELQLNKANTTDTKAPFLDIDLSIANGFVTYKIYDERDVFDFDMVNFPFWMVTFLAVLRMVYTFRNLLGLQESAIM